MTVIILDFSHRVSEITRKKNTKKPSQVGPLFQFKANAPATLVTYLEFPHHGSSHLGTYLLCKEQD